MPDPSPRRPDTDPQRYVGQPLKRLEDPKLITGAGQYVEDLKLPGLTYLAFLRSPHAHARVTAIRIEAAQKAPGVVRVVTAKDLGPLRPTPYMVVLPGLKAFPYQYLADGVVDSTGVPVAAIVAESPSLARDAADLIEVEYESLPAVSDPERALGPGAPLVHPEFGANQAFSFPMKGGDVNAAFARAAHIAKVRVEHNRLAGAPMEPRGVVARYEPGTGELTLWLTTQNPFTTRADLASVLDYPEHKLRLVALDVGGGFGVKGPLYREEVIAAVLARQLGRPVQWMSTRNEDLLTTHHGRATVTEAEAAVSSDGEIIGLRGKAIFDLGAHLLSLSLVPTMSNSVHVLGPYRIRNAELLSVGVYTNTGPTGPYRGSGRPVGVYLIERLVDEAARLTGLDPVEIRRRNFIPPDAFPYRTAFGTPYDSGNYARALDRALELADYTELRREQAEKRKRGDLVGIGVATYVESTNVLGWESGVVRVERTGKVTAITGSSPHGQGHETTFAQIVAESAHRGMGLPPDESPGLESTVFFRQDLPAFSFGAGVAVVSVDRETGRVRLERLVAVDDCGNAINPLLVDGQIVGALAQGIGQAMLEHVVYGEQGEMITGTFMEYALPRADDMPELVLDRTVTPSPVNPLGAKGVGEGGACVAPPAIVNAVVDALSPFGIHHVDSPLTAEKIWRAIHRPS